jgi:uncharacterized repeat protein (TIGR03806 family)
LSTTYVYGDFDTGRIWMYQRKLVPEVYKKDGKPLERLVPTIVHQEIARTTYRIITWSEDADGELYFVDFTGGRIYQLVKAEMKLGEKRGPLRDPGAIFDFITGGNDFLQIEKLFYGKEFALEFAKQHNITDGKFNRKQYIAFSAEYQAWRNAGTAESRFPRKLSQTGIFKSTKDHVVADGIIPYSVNAQLWGDHAEKERFLAIPNNGQIGFDEITYPQPSPGAPPGWRFPDGTVLVKTFSMDMERGNPKSRKRIETRLLHFQQFPGTQEYGDQYWRGYTYRWNEDQTDADLVDDKGADVPMKIKVGDKTVEQNYRIPSRAECTLCHTNAAKFALGVSTLQMNRDHVYPGNVIANQLATLEHIGVFSKNLPKEPAKLPKLADFHDKGQAIDVRARSYLHSNCSHCHIKWGGGNAEFKLLVDLKLEDMGIVNVAPAHGNFKIDGAKLLVPGDPDKSMILHRMNMTGLGRMPHIGSRVVDEQAVNIVREWIKGMK